MNFTKYKCPVCRNEMDRDLMAFMNHVHQHILDEIKKLHPELVSSNGECVKCEQYYQEQLVA